VSEVVQFKPKTERDDPHIAGHALCAACKNEWMAVAPVGTTHLECPACKRIWGTFKHAIEPKIVWHCSCEEQLFWITPSGIMCRKCGEIQTGF